MSKVLKICFLFVALSFIVGNIAMADDKDQQRDRKRDGSCEPEVTATDGVPVLAADQDRQQDRQQDRKRDGSCDSEVTATDGVPVLAADQDRKQDRNRDGSCDPDAVPSDMVLFPSLA